ERERGIAAGVNEEMLVGRGAGAVAVRVDGVELGAIASRFHDEGPEMHVGAEDVRAPGENQLRVAELLGLGAVAEAQRCHETRGARTRADGAVEPRCTEPVKK